MTVTLKQAFYFFLHNILRLLSFALVIAILVVIAGSAFSIAVYRCSGYRAY